MFHRLSKSISQTICAKNDKTVFKNLKSTKNYKIWLNKRSSLFSSKKSSWPSTCTVFQFWKLSLLLIWLFFFLKKMYCFQRFLSHTFLKKTVRYCFFFLSLNLFILTRSILWNVFKQTHRENFIVKYKNFIILVHVHTLPRNSCYLRMPKTQKLGRRKVVLSGQVCVIASLLYFW